MNIASAGKTFSLIRNVLDTTKKTLSPIEFPEKKPLLLPDGSRYFKRVTPEECGVDSLFLKDYIQALCDDSLVGQRYFRSLEAFAGRRLPYRHVFAMQKHCCARNRGSYHKRQIENQRKDR